MEVTIRIPDELVALAKARGLPVEEYVEELLSQFLGSEGTEERSASEALKKFGPGWIPCPSFQTRFLLC